MKNQFILVLLLVQFCTLEMGQAMPGKSLKTLPLVASLELIINFDNYPEETSWEIQDNNGTVVASGGTYPNQTDKSTLNIPITLNDGCYTFIMKDSYGDGLYSANPAPGYNGSYQLNMGGTVLVSGSGNFGSSKSDNFCINSACSNNTLPTVSITSPSSGSSVTSGSNFTITASASDVDGTISKVDFYNGTTLLFSDIVSPFAYTVTNASGTSYSLTARAYDNCLGVTISSVVNVSVSSNPCSNNTLPTASISAPANGATFTTGQSIQIDANATDVDGTVSKVEFFNNGTKIGEDNTSPYSYIITNAATGTYSITVVATDNCGQTSATSGARSFTVSTGGGGGSNCNPWANSCLTTGSIYRSGQVGIGTSLFGQDNSFLLFVKGGVVAEKMKLELCAAGGWCDYVFDPNYKLMPLAQVAAYINKYRHLPNMPSEKEMEKEGTIDIGAITVKQQEKIEEVFLHLIELNKQMLAMQVELDKLKKENQELKKSINAKR